MTKRLIRRERPGRSLQLLFEPRDLWVGIYWNRNHVVWGSVIEVYICLVPMLPIRFAWTRVNRMRRGDAL